MSEVVNNNEDNNDKNNDKNNDNNNDGDNNNNKNENDNNDDNVINDMMIVIIIIIPPAPAPLLLLPLLTTTTRRRRRTVTVAPAVVELFLCKSSLWKLEDIQLRALRFVLDDFVSVLLKKADVMGIKIMLLRYHAIAMYTYEWYISWLSKSTVFEQGKSEGFDSCDWPSNLTQIGFKSSIFQPVWPWKLMDDPEKH